MKNYIVITSSVSFGLRVRSKLRMESGVRSTQKR